MESFFEKNAEILAATPGLVEDFQKIMIRANYRKNSLLHEAGKICDYMFIIFSGIARVYYENDGKDITTFFAAEHETITAVDSFVQRKKSKYNVEALEDVIAFKVSHQDLENLFNNNPKYERFGRLLALQLYMELVERVDDLQLKSAQERYDALLTKSPYLVQRVASKHIASFLSITPETLSRIKSKL